MQSRGCDNSCSNSTKSTPIAGYLSQYPTMHLNMADADHSKTIQMEIISSRGEKANVSMEEINVGRQAEKLDSIHIRAQKSVASGTSLLPSKTLRLPA